MSIVPSSASAADLPPIRPLVVPLRFEPDETLIGGIARSTRMNVLRHTGIILEEVGLRLPRAGAVGISTTDFVERLAEKLGCAPGEAEARLHRYVEQPVGRASNTANGRLPVRWGPGGIERRHLDLSRRRISPGALKTSAHHRWNWMVELLPFCLETLEPLVDACRSCEARLGWRHAVGIGVCEACERPVRPSPGSALPHELTGTYRRFAATLSPVPGERTAAVGPLAPELRGAGAPAFTDLVLSLGKAFETGRAATSEGPGAPLAIAAAAVRGMEMIEDWPHRLRDAVGGTLDAGGTVGRARVAETVRRMGGGASERAGLVRAALPEAFERIGRALSMAGPVMLAKELGRDAGIGLPGVRALEDADVIRGIETHTGGRTYRQYDRARGGEVARVWRGSEDCTRLEQRLGVPHYAVEQLVRLGEVEPELSVIATALSPRLRVRRSSADAFIAGLKRMRLDGPAPVGALTLHAASRTAGGGLKAWGPVLAALSRGELRCWSLPGADDGAPRTRPLCKSTLVDGELANAIFRRASPEEAGGFEAEDELTQLDACDLLNVDSLQLARAGRSGGIVFRAVGQALRAGLEPVLALAASTIATPEIAFGLKLDANPTARVLDAHAGIRRATVGWCRDDVARAWTELLDVADAIRSGRERRELNAATPNGLSAAAIETLDQRSPRATFRVRRTRGLTRRHPGHDTSGKS